jgi:hypothetical protein
MFHYAYHFGCSLFVFSLYMALLDDLSAIEDWTAAMNGV